MSAINRRPRQPSGFIPERLVEARMARGLSQTGLASITGLHRQSISNYESGRQSPREDNLIVIANKLGFPRGYFYKPTRQRDTHAIHFRSLARASQADRDQATCRLHWIQDLIDYLDEFFDPQVVNLPDYGRGRSPKSISDKEIETIATNVRRDFGLKDGPISNMTWLLQNNGILVFRMSGPELETEDLDGFSTWMDNGKNPVIVLSGRRTTLCRDRMNLAHELGHLILHKNHFPENRDEHKIMERQVFLFAGCLLLPSTTYFKSISYPSLDAFLAVKQVWKVSVKAQIERCYRANLIGEDRRRLMYMQYNRRGWSTLEPLDDEFPLEEPNYVTDSLQMLVSEGIQDSDSIKEALSLSEKDIMSITGLKMQFFRSYKQTAEGQKPRLRLVKE
ncbi:XRE family transcriptional regulator [Fundidesulfovibrio butyratiphilus]